MLYQDKLTPDLFTPSKNLINLKSYLLEDLSQIIQINSKFRPAAVQYIHKYDNKVIPMEFSTIMLFYNKRIFKELGLKIPQKKYLSIEDFLFYSYSILKKSKKIPLVMGLKGDDIGKVFFIFDLFLLNLKGESLFKKYSAGELYWNDQSILITLRMIVSLITAKEFINEDFLDISDKDAQKLFRERKATMYLSNSSFLASEFRPSEMGVVPFVKISPSIPFHLPVSFSKIVSMNNFSNCKDNTHQLLKIMLSKEMNQFWNQEIKTLSSLQGSVHSNVASEIYHFLDLYPSFVYENKIRDISYEYFEKAAILITRILSLQIQLRDIPETMNQFHKEVLKNGWYQ